MHTTTLKGLLDGITSKDELYHVLRNHKHSIRRLVNQSTGKPFIVPHHLLCSTKKEFFLSLLYNTGVTSSLCDAASDVTSHSGIKQSPIPLIFPRCRPHEEKFRRQFKLATWLDVPCGSIFTYELSRRNTWRCRFVGSDGFRCREYSKNNTCFFCWHHYALAAKLIQNMSSEEQNLLGASIKSQSIRELYEKHLNDPNRKNIESELALMRTLLTAVVSNIQSKSLADIPLDAIATVVTLCEKVSSAVLTMTNIETKLGDRFSIEQVNVITLRLLESFVKITQPNEEQCLQLAAVFENLSINKTLPVITLHGSTSDTTKQATQSSKATLSPEATDIVALTYYDKVTPSHIIPKHFTANDIAVRVDPNVYSDRFTRQQDAANFKTKLENLKRADPDVTLQLARMGL